MIMKQIPGGVTAAKGYKAGGVKAAIKSKKKNDLCLIVSECEAAAAGVYTLNRVKAAPIYVTMEHLEDGVAKAIIANSGNANAFAHNSHESVERMCELAAEHLNILADDVIVASTGVIGAPFDITKVEKVMPDLVASLSDDESGSHEAAVAIMTTDTVSKEFAVEFNIGGKAVTMGGIAKGSGMIHPNMGTMLAFITTDCAITPELLHEALAETVKVTYNRVSVDGDTSTNDMCVIMANGMAENPLIEWKDDNYQVFLAALKEVNEHFAKAIARDGEGATKLVTCHVCGSRSDDSAERIAMEVIKSSLVKAAMFGSDANWGRVLCAMGYSKAPFRPEYVDIAFASAAGEIVVCKQGDGQNFDEDKAKAILSQNEVTIEINLNEGDHEATAWGCDLTYEYVRINGDYRS